MNNELQSIISGEWNEAVKNERKEIGPSEKTRKTPPRLFVKYPAPLKSRLHLHFLYKSDECHLTAVEERREKLDTEISGKKTKKPKATFHGEALDRLDGVPDPLRASARKFPAARD